MGRYLTIVDQRFEIKAENVEAAYKAAVALNAVESKKSTRRNGPDPQAKPADSKSVAASPDVSFRGVAWNYDEKCRDLAEVLREFGFEPEVSPDGAITALFFDEKSGDEELLLEAIAPYVEDGSMLGWAESYTEMWGTWFYGGALRYGPCETVWKCPLDEAA